MTLPHAGAPYLSIVCAFGGAQRKEQWLAQTKRFLAATAHQAEQHRLSIEIVLVDWKAGGAVGASDLLAPLPQNDFATIRILSAPDGDGPFLDHSIDRERWAQNIGIRRAKGQFILATGTEIILSGAMMGHFATRPLRPRCFYFALRFDTQPEFPADQSIAAGDVEAGCRRGAYGAGPSVSPITCDGEAAAITEESWTELASRVGVESQVERSVFPVAYTLGNFLLMNRENWFELGGFPEWNLGDRHFDRIVMAQAHHRGWERQVIPSACHFFSFSRLRERDVTQDFYVDEDGDARIRVESPVIRNLNDYHVLSILLRLRAAFASSRVAVRVNGPDWGLAGIDVAERTLSQKVL